MSKNKQQRVNKKEQEDNVPPSGGRLSKCKLQNYVEEEVEFDHQSEIDGKFLYIFKLTCSKLILVL